MSQPRNRNPFLGVPDSTPDAASSTVDPSPAASSVVTMVTTSGPVPTAVGSAAKTEASSPSATLPLGAWIAIGVTSGLFVLILAMFVGRFIMKRRHERVDYEGGYVQPHATPMPRPQPAMMDAQTLMRVKQAPELPQVQLPAKDMQRVGNAVAWRPPSMAALPQRVAAPPQAHLQRSLSTNSLPLGSTTSLPRTAGGFAKQAATTGRKPPPGPIVTAAMPARSSVYASTANGAGQNGVHGLNSVLKTRSSITGELLLVNNGQTTLASRPSPTWQPVARTSMLSVVDNASDLQPSPTVQRRATVDAFIRAQQSSIPEESGGGSSSSAGGLSRRNSNLSTSPVGSLQPSLHSERRGSPASLEAIPRLSTPFQNHDDDPYPEQTSPDLEELTNDHLDAYIPTERAASPAVQYPEVWFRPSPAPVSRPNDRECKPSGLRQQDIFLLEEDEDTSEEETG